MSKTSVIIPCYRDPYLKRTLEDILEKADGEIEILVFLDGWDDSVELLIDSNITYMYSIKRVGMRRAINNCIKHASGEYIMKCDSHCMFAKGFDTELKKSTRDKTISVPSRYHLDPVKWERFKKPLNFAYLKYPGPGKEVGFRTARSKEIEKKMMLVDDIIIFQGSCWFMKHSFMVEIGGLDEEMFGEWGMEAHELSMKAWLVNNGRVVRNQKTWYAHYKKPIQKSSMRENMIENMKKTFYMDINDSWPGQTKPFKWLIDKWPLFPGWDENWYKNKVGKKI